MTTINDAMVVLLSVEAHFAAADDSNEGGDLMLDAPTEGRAWVTVEMSLDDARKMPLYKLVTITTEEA